MYTLWKQDKYAIEKYETQRLENKVAPEFSEATLDSENETVHKTVSARFK